jgi:hypothetical protein
MDTIWVKSKWSQDELDRKRVELRIPAHGGIVHGLGEFRVRQNPDGLLAIDAVTDVQGRNWAERIRTRYHLPQAAVDRIAKHPDTKVGDFLLE